MKHKQTAVEWLKKELEDYGSSSHLSLDLDSPTSNIQLWETFDELCKQAKEMEKQQIIDAYDLGSLSEMQYPNPKTVIENGEQYYNETYKGGKQ